jgi:hypothetical protein
VIPPGDDLEMSYALSDRTRRGGARCGWWLAPLAQRSKTERVDMATCIAAYNGQAEPMQTLSLECWNEGWTEG